ncbi:MAG: LrgB family protein [Alphaproteobacteria bacterium]
MSMAADLIPLAGTVACFAAADLLHTRTGHHPLTHPVLVTIAVVSAVLLVTDLPYADYFASADVLHLMLGPATVALAVPMHQHWDRLKGLGVPLGVTLVLGSVAAMALSAGFAALGQASDKTFATLLPKSATAPVAMDLAARLGGIPALAAALVILTGTIGAAFGPPWLARLGLRDPRAVGFAMGLVAHGIGTAAAFRVGPIAGVFATLGMALNAVMTTALVAVISLVYSAA